MVIHVNLDTLPGMPSPSWEDILREEEATGRIPLPAVDHIRSPEDRPPTIVLLAPAVVPGATRVFIKDLHELSAQDRSTLLDLITLLRDSAQVAGVTGRLEAVYHLGGLDYEFYGSEVARLQDFPHEQQAALWRILNAIAQFGAQHVDSDASRVRTPPTDSID